MENVIRVRDHTVAFCMVILTGVSGYFVYRSAVDRHELRKVREQNKIIAQHVKTLQDSFKAIRSYTQSADGFASAASFPGALRERDELSLIVNNPESLGLFGRLSLSAKVRGESKARSDKQSDLERFTETMTTIDSVSRDTEIVVRRVRSLATLFKYNQDMMRSIPSLKPTVGIITSEFGTRMSPFEGKRHFHPGLDIAAVAGSAVVAPADGTVTFVGDFENLGKSVLIDHGAGILTRYGHLNTYNVQVGQVVRRGEAIASVGNTGRSTGPHLHYEIWIRNVAVNPRDFFFDLEAKSEAKLAASPNDKGFKKAAELTGMGGEE